LEQGLYQRSGTNLLKIAFDDALAFRDAFQDRYEAAVFVHALCAKRRAIVIVSFDACTVRNDEVHSFPSSLRRDVFSLAPRGFTRRRQAEQLIDGDG
jgi:hypothetical protein